jgi:iron complex outermembrane receptor protein
MWGRNITVTLATFVVVPGLSEAQEPSRDIGLEEIVITAQKREQRLQDVPIAVSVVDADALERALVGRIENIQALVPTLTLRQGTTTANSAVVLRGIGTISFADAAEPAIATVIDGVVYARSGQTFTDLFDIERIEVLRGPQGTLFGKNASAGALNVVTRGPTDEFEAGIAVTAFEDDELQLRGSISGPITDTLGARLSLSHGEFDGHLENVANGREANGYDRQAARLMLDWAPTDRLDFRFIGDYSEMDDNCCAEAIGTVPTSAAVLANLGAAVPLADETRRINHNLESRTIGKSGGASVQVDYDFGPLTLTSITAHREWESRELREGDFMAAGASHVGVFQLHDDGIQDWRQFSQELRLASPSGERIEYLIGLFYWDVDGDRTFTREDITCTASTLPVDATGLAPCQPGASTFGTPSATSQTEVEFENRAVFGNATFNVTDALRVLFGLRYTDDEVSFRHVRVNTSGMGGPGISAVPFPPPGGSSVGSTDETDFSGRLGVQFDFNDDIMAYGTYSQGYKGPAFNVFFNMSANDAQPIAAETADAYEVGLKTTLFDRRLQLNVAAFYTEYDNFQANSFRLISGSVVTSLTNAGKVETSGVELEFVARPTAALLLAGGIVYADAQIKEFFCPPGSPATCTSREGERLPLAPEVKYSLTGEYVWQLGALPFDLFANAQYSWQDEQFSSLGAFPAERIDSYGLLNAGIGIADREDRYRLSLVGRNLTDESYAALITPGGQGSAFRYIIPRDADRYFGLDLRLRF